MDRRFCQNLSELRCRNQWAALCQSFFVTVYLIAMGGGQATRADIVWTAPSGHSAPSGRAASNAYRLGIDDVLEITVRNYDDLNCTVTVRPDGKISVPRAGELQAAGLTTVMLATKIQTELSKTLRRAYVTVTVKDVRSQRARIVGAVKTDGVYDLKPDWRVMDLVAVAGGLSTKPTRITGRVIRDGAVMPFNVEQAVQNPEGSANIPLRANDLVVLDEQYIDRLIHVVGEVAKPGAYDLEEGLTAVSLLARAGGPNEKATLRNAHVLRGNQKIMLDLQSVIVDGQSNKQVADFTFQAGDVLVIPENTKRYGVMGYVSKPGYYPVPDKVSDATTVRALSTAGGALPNGDLKRATVTRTDNGKVEVIAVDLDAMLKGEEPDDLVLQSGDLLNIPEIRELQVHVLGKVAKPGAYELKEDTFTSPLTLVSEAGSPVEGAALQKAYVLRGETQIPLDLHAVLDEGRNEPGVTGFKMTAGDILVIPENQLRYGVMGQVTKPTYLPYPERKEEATVLNALAAAGGPLPPGYAGGGGGDLGKAAIIRMVNGKPTRIPVNIEEMLKYGSVASTMMLPNDILYIPPKKKGFQWASILSPLAILSGQVF